MSQLIEKPAASDTLANTRPKWNNSVDALASLMSGTSEPGASVRYPYQLWADTTTGLLKMRNAADTAWITLGTMAAAHLGLVSLSTAGQQFSVSLDMGGNSIENLAVGGTNSAARKAELDLKAPLASPSFTGQVALAADPTLDTSAVRRGWANSTYVGLSGGTMTGRLGVPSSPAAGAGQALRRDEVEGLTTFSVGSGHDHDGVNSKPVNFSDLVGKDHLHTIYMPDDQRLSLASGIATGTTWTQVDITSYPVVGISAFAIIEVRLTGTNPNITVEFRRGSGATNMQCRVSLSIASGGACTTRQVVFVPTDISDTFDYQVVGTSGTADLDLVGYVRRII